MRICTSNIQKAANEVLQLHQNPWASWSFPIKAVFKAFPPIEKGSKATLIQTLP